jgi:FkbM family methyltransferase
MPDAARRIYWRLHREMMRLRWRARPAEFVVCGSGRRMYLDPTDQRAFALWLSHGDTDPPNLALWRQLLALRDWTLVVDVGANHGEMLLNAALPEGARVLAFEPNPVVARVLRRSLSETGMAVELREEAVGETAGEVRLFVDRAWSGGSTVVAEKAARGVEVVTVAEVALAEVFAGLACWPGSLLLKLDIEGHEPAALRGLMGNLERWDAVAVMVELHRLPAADLAWVDAHFDVAQRDPKSGVLRATSAAAAARAEGWLDAVLFRSGEARRYDVT